MEQNELIQWFKNEISEIRKSLQSPTQTNPLLLKWVPRVEVMKFFGYGSTQMAQLEKNEGLIFSKIGKRKFYLRDSIEQLLEKNVIS